MSELQEKFNVSQRRACRVLGQPQSSQRFEGKPYDEDERQTKRILQFVRERPRWGYRGISQLLRRDGETINMKSMYRLWKASGLKLPRKRRRKRSTGVRVNACDVQVAAFDHDVWTWDCVQSSTVDGRTIRFLNIVDEYTRQCLAIKVAAVLRARRQSTHWQSYSRFTVFQSVEDATTVLSSTQPRSSNGWIRSASKSFTSSQDRHAERCV